MKERQYGGTERMSQNPLENLVEVASHALFALLLKHGGTLSHRDNDGQWQWSVPVEGREGRTIWTYGVGKTPELAIQNHSIFRKANNI